MALGRGKTQAPATNTTPELPPDEVSDAIATVVDAGIEAERQEIARQRPVEELVPEVMTHPSAFDADALRALDNFDDAIRMATDAHGPIVDASDELGDGFALLDSDHKGRLVGVPLLFMEWNFYPGDFGTMFVAARIVARNPDGGISRYIVNDGSTGIADQLAAYSKRTGKYGGLLVRQGLRVSEYTYCEICRAVKCEVPEVHKSAGAFKKAETFYVDTSA